MSASCTRPPGPSTRAISRTAARLSGTRLITPLLVTTDTDRSGSGIASAFPASTWMLVARARSAVARWDKRDKRVAPFLVRLLARGIGEGRIV